jgi:hypothetical protein
MNAKPDRLAALAAFAPLLRERDGPFSRPAPQAGDGSRENPFAMPYVIEDEIVGRFRRMAYDTDWIMNFDWAEWGHGSDGQRFFEDRGAVAQASEGDLAKLITAVVRQDRFVEGGLAKSFETGLIGAVCDRAVELQSSRI